MQAVKRWVLRKHRLPLVGAMGLIALISALITFCMFTLSPLPLYVLHSLTQWSRGLIPFLNWLPIFLCMLWLYFATSRLILSIGVPGFVAIAMACVNQAKLALRGDPLLHWDLALLSEFIGISKGLSEHLLLLCGVAVAAFILAMVLLSRLFRFTRLPARRRIAGTVLCTVALAFANATLYSDAALEARLPIWGSFYNQADVHNARGNLYEFLLTWNLSRKAAPEGYDPQHTRDFIAAQSEKPTPPLAEARPNVIMIMGEALSALSESPVLDFSNHRDPLAHFKALGAEGISGSLVVPSRGGGTADTEFDVLTAIPSRFIRNASYAYRAIAGPFESLPSLLGGIGYDTFALHPGYRWFYNRQNVYRYLGFEEAVFEDAFAREAYLDTFISEEATYDMLLAMIDQRLAAAPASPFFGFCVTIQNHAAYTDRYLPEGTVLFENTAGLTDLQVNELSNYFKGTIDADNQLARLSAYLDAQPEPFVLVCFGDHLPAIDEALYSLLIPGAKDPDGSFRKQTREYTVPFIIWQNAAAKAAGILPAARPEEMTMSSNFLGAYLLSLLGLDSLSPYWAYTNEVRADYPVLLEAMAFTPDGAAAPVSAASDYLHWAYDRMAEP